MAFKLNDLTTHREAKRRRHGTTVLFFVLFYFSLSLSISLVIKSYIKHHYSTYGDTELKH